MRHLSQDATLRISLARTLVLLTKPQNGMTNMAVVSLAKTGTVVVVNTIKNLLRMVQ